MWVVIRATHPSVCAWTSQGWHWSFTKSFHPLMHYEPCFPGGEIEAYSKHSIRSWLSPDHSQLVSRPAESPGITRTRAIVPCVDAGGGSQGHHRQISSTAWRGANCTWQEWQSAALRRNQTVLDFPSPPSLRREGSRQCVCVLGGAEKRARI